MRKVSLGDDTVTVTLGSISECWEPFPQWAGAFSNQRIAVLVDTP